MSDNDLLREAELLGSVRVEANIDYGYRVTLKGRADDIGVEITSTRPVLDEALEAVIALARKWNVRRA